MDDSEETCKEYPPCGFLVGAKLGAKVGQTFNKTFLNIDGIYSAAFATGNYVDAAEAYWPYVERMARNFESTPEEYHQDFYLTIQLYGKLVAGSYKSCGDIYAQIDKAWVESFWNWVTNQSGNEKTINTCTKSTRQTEDSFTQKGTHSA